MKVSLKIRVEKDVEFSEELQPEDFVNCDTIHDLEYEIKKRLNTFKDDKSRLISEKLDIPKEFIDKWKCLVGFIPDNVMTQRKKLRMLSGSKVYEETYSGNELNYKKTSYSWDIFDLGDYKDFYFRPENDYHCYLIDNDHWDYSETRVLYCERIS